VDGRSRRRRGLRHRCRCRRGQDRGGAPPGGTERRRGLSHPGAGKRAPPARGARIRRPPALPLPPARARRPPSSPALPPGRERAPIAAAVVAALGAALFILPLLGLLWTAPWTDLVHVLFEPEALMAMRLSLVCSLAATAVSIVLGLPLAWVQARSSFPGRSLLRALTLLPVVLPPVVGGVALLSVFGRRALTGQLLAPLGIRLPFTTAGAVLAETFVAMPFFVLSMEGVLGTLDRRLEDAARTLGANRWTVFRRITVPLVRPSVAAGAALC